MVITWASLDSLQHYSGKKKSKKNHRFVRPFEWNVPTVGYSLFVHKNNCIYFFHVPYTLPFYLENNSVSIIRIFYGVWNYVLWFHKNTQEFIRNHKKIIRIHKFIFIFINSYDFLWILVYSCEIIKHSFKPRRIFNSKFRGGNTSWDYGTIDFGILWNSLELFGIIFGIPQKFV